MKRIDQLSIGSIPSERPSLHDIDRCVWLSIIRDSICRTSFFEKLSEKLQVWQPIIDLSRLMCVQS